jgi:hypothetical protein
LGEIVVVPGLIVIELEDVEVVTGDTEVVDVLLVVEGGYVAVETAWKRGGRRTGELGEIVVMPDVIVVKLEDVDVATDDTQEIDVLLLIEGGLVAGEITLDDGGSDHRNSFSEK